MKQTVITVISVLFAGVIIWAGVSLFKVQHSDTQTHSMDKKTDQQTNTTKQGDGPYYYVEFSTSGASFYVTINDRPHMETDAFGGAFKASPVNVNLIGEENEIRIIAGPTSEPDSGRKTTPEDAELTGSVKLYQSEDLFGTDDGKTIAEFNLQDAIGKQREKKQQEFQQRLREAEPNQKQQLKNNKEKITSLEFPIEMTVEFDSPKTQSFAYRLTEAPVVEDRSALKDYAIKLRDLMRDQDSRGLYEQIKPKNKDYNQAYYESDGYQWWKDGFEAFYESELRTDFDRDDIGLRPLLGGRLWEVYVKNGEPDKPWSPTGRRLFKTKGKNGKISWMRVIVGRVDGELRIVR
jgi:hypothetical protein